MKVPMRLSFADVEQQEAEGEHPRTTASPGQEPNTIAVNFPAPATVDKAKGLLDSLKLLVTKNDDMTPVDVLNNLLALDKQAAALEKEAETAKRGSGHGFRTIRFGASRIAIHLFRAFTSEGKEKNRALVHEILKFTPHLAHARQKGHFDQDDELRRMGFPKGTLNPNEKLGPQKTRLHMTEADYAKRRMALNQQRANARRERRGVSEDEAASIFGGEEKPASIAPTASTTAAAAAPKGAGKRKRGMAGLGQDQVADDELTNYLTQQENSFRPGDVESKAAVLDKVTNLNAAVAAGQDAKTAIKSAEGGETNYLAIGLGVLTVGAILYFIMKKKK